MKNTPLALKTAALTAAACVATGCQQQTKPQTNPAKTVTTNPPDIFLIVADDLGYSDIGCYGNKFIETPCLDSLAQAGVMFTSGYAACPVCSPTRAALLTGKYPVSVDVTDWIPGRQANGPREGELYLGPTFRDNLDTTETTLAEIFKKAGYHTVHAGKWHLGSQGYLPQNQGFDKNIAGYQCGAPGKYYWPYNPGWCHNPMLDSLSKQIDSTTYLTDALLQQAMPAITQSKPVFLYLPFYQVHIPIQARADLEAYYLKKAKSLDSTRLINHRYAAMVSAMDQNIRKLMHHWRQRGRLQNTVVMFSSDNGGLSVTEGKHTPATDNAPLRGGKGHLYEGGIRVPYIVAGQQVQQGVQSDFKISSVDIMPTLLEAAQLNVPSGIEGQSFWQLATNGTQPKQPHLYWHYPHYSNQGGTPGGVVISGRYKYISSYIGQKSQLFDLENDIAETQNLADSLPDVAQQLSSQLKAWLNDHNAKMPTPLAEVK